jgi:hypothetical protein
MYGLVFSKLIESSGYSWTLRYMAFIMIGLFVISLPLVLWGASNTGPVTDGKKRIMLDKNVLTDIPFWAFTAALSTIGMAYWVPYYYIPTFAKSALGTSQAWSSNMLMISQTASVFGRYFAAFAAGRFGIMLTWLVATMVSSVVCLMWIGTNTFNSFLGFCALWGQGIFLPS